MRGDWKDERPEGVAHGWVGQAPRKKLPGTVRVGCSRHPPGYVLFIQLYENWPICKPRDPGQFKGCHAESKISKLWSIQ